MSSPGPMLSDSTGSGQLYDFAILPVSPHDTKWWLEIPQSHLLVNRRKKELRKGHIHSSLRSLCAFMFLAIILLPVMLAACVFE